MGHASIVYGNIIGPPRYDERGLFFHQKNKAVIESLPPDDLIWPWIDRGMFLVQDPESVKMYRDQVIVFGACYKRVEPEWEEWLRKFEAILKQLYWITATIHLDSEIEGRNTYLWICDQPDNFTANDPVPISSWSFSGGPRKFDLYWDGLNSNKTSRCLYAVDRKDKSIIISFGGEEWILD